MAAKVGQVVVNFLLNTAKFESDIKRATRSMNQMGREFSNAGRAMTMGLTLPMVGAGAAAIKLAGEFEQTKIAFNTMLGSTDKSTKFLKDLRDFAAKTPFEFQDLTRASKRMMALGFSSEQVMPTLKAIGDAVAGLGGGSEMIDRVTLALGQMQAKGKVSAQEMNQLAESGIPAWDLLSKRIGKSIPEAMKLAEKGAISASVAIPAILEGMNARFGGLMSKQNQTLLGQMSNLKDQFTFIVADLGAAIMPMAKQIMDNFVKPLADQIKGLVDWFSSLSKENQALIVKTMALTAAVGPLVWAFGSLATALSSTLTLSARLLNLVSSGGGLIGAVKNLGAAAAVTGAVFAGWKIAEWIDKLDLFGRHARVATNEIIKQAEGYRKQATDIGAVKEAMAKYQTLLDKGTISQNTFNGILNDLTKQRASETLEQYRDRMKGMVDQFKAAHPELFKTKEAANAATTSVSNLAGAFDNLSDSVKRTERALTDYEVYSAVVDMLHGRMVESFRQTKSDIDAIWGDTQRKFDDLKFDDLKIDSMVQPINDDVFGAFDSYRRDLERMRNSFSDVMYSDQHAQQLAAYQDYYAQLDQLRAENFISEEEYSTARKNLIQQENAVKLSYYQNFFGSLASMQSSNIRALAAIGKAAAITQATINTYEGATKALAQGGIWGSINMAAVMATGFAQVAAIAAQGFAKGGLVPGGEQLIRVNENGPETVMNAKATREYGPLLQILNSPAPINNRLESSPIARAISRPSVNVSIANYGTSKQFDVQQIDENNIRIIARDEAMGTLRRMGPEVIANDLAYANSRTSKAVARHTTARRADR